MKRSIVPIALTMLGLMLLVGCFYFPVVPHPNGSDGAAKIFDAVGTQTSKHQLRLNVATRAQVLAFAPNPLMASLDGKSLAYSSPGVIGYWFVPLCFAISPQREEFYIRLNFDDAGVLRSYIVEHQKGPLTSLDKIISSGMYHRNRFPTWPPPIKIATTRHST